jgi:hypothetical protein
MKPSSPLSNSNAIMLPSKLDAKIVNPSGVHARSDIDFAAKSWQTTKGLDELVFQILKVLSCPAHATTVTKGWVLYPLLSVVSALTSCLLNNRGENVQTSVVPSCPIKLISLSQTPRFMIATELTGPLTAFAAAI